MPEAVNNGLYGLRLLKQTTCFVFLFHLFDDYESSLIDEKILAKVITLLRNYSVRRLVCNVASNSLRGMYKFLYRRVFADSTNKQHYYDAIVSFMQQMTSRDVIPSDSDFEIALKNNDIYGKHALCRYLLVSIENMGKEKVQTQQLSIEHIMPQNRSLSWSWRNMLGTRWYEIHDRLLNTLGNLTLTGYNSELGDRPFKEKVSMLNKMSSKITVLNKDVIDKATWNEQTILARAERLSDIIMKMYPIEAPEKEISFIDTRFKNHTCADPSEATHKTVRWYELLGERETVTTFADMMRSVSKKLYDLDPSIISKMAKNNERFPGWTSIAFSYDKSKVRGTRKLPDTEIYIMSGLSASDCVYFIKELLLKYDLDIDNDFIYSAKAPDEDRREGHSELNELH